MPADPKPYPVREVGAIISAALRDAKTTKRHPAEVTSDRLGNATTTWRHLFTGEELDLVAQIRHALEEIAEGRRGPQ